MNRTEQDRVSLPVPGAPGQIHYKCNRKSLKFDTIAKIKVTSVLEIFMLLRYVMYIHMICEKKEIKTGGHRSYKKMGPFQK